MPRGRLLPEPIRSWTRRVRAFWISVLLRRTNISREPLSYTFLRGRGIEIGALNNPMPVGPGTHVSYVDRLPREELVKLYVDVDPKDILPVDIITDGETLSGIADDSQDFVIANHMVEHCQDPIGTLRHMLRVLRVGGVLYLTLPDKRFTFDHARAVTSFREVCEDYLHGPESSLHGHYMDWLTNVEGLTDQAAVMSRADGLALEGANIHFHAWDQAGMMEMLAGMQRELHFRFDVEIMSRTGLEVIFVMRKTGPVPPTPTR